MNQNAQGDVQDAQISLWQSPRMQRVTAAAKKWGLVVGTSLLVGVVIGQQMSIRARAARYRAE